VPKKWGRARLQLFGGEADLQGLSRKLMFQYHAQLLELKLGAFLQISVKLKIGISCLI
jgi:hypothetical protein